MLAKLRGSRVVLGNVLLVLFAVVRARYPQLGPILDTLLDAILSVPGMAALNIVARVGLTKTPAFSGLRT